MALELLTLGHGTATADELAGLIREARIESVADVRAVPKSRRHPQYWRDEMERWVPEKTGSAYRWEPSLGGFRKADRNSSNVALRHPSFRAFADYMETESFKRGLAALLAQAATARVAVLCSEAVWWRCHRRLISDAAVLLHGVRVQHLMHDGRLRPHLPTPGVRVTDTAELRYDVLFGPEGPAPDEEPSERATEEAGGDSACWLHHVCEDCGAIVDAKNGHRPGCEYGA